MNCTHGRVGKFCPRCTATYASQNVSSSHMTLGSLFHASIPNFIAPSMSATSSTKTPSGNHYFSESLARARKIQPASGKAMMNFQIPKVEILVDSLVDDPWQLITHKVLPLFHGAGLSTSIEELNILLTYGLFFSFSPTRINM